jgi:hypothetical protein
MAETTARKEPPQAPIRFRGKDLTVSFGPSIDWIRQITPPEQDPEFVKTVLRAHEELQKRLKAEGGSPDVAKKAQVATRIVHSMFPDYNHGERRMGKEEDILELPDDLIFHFTGKRSGWTSKETDIANAHYETVQSHQGRALSLSKLLPNAVCSSQAMLLSGILAQEGIRSVVAGGRFVEGSYIGGKYMKGYSDGEDHAVVIIPSGDNRSHNDENEILADPVTGFSLPRREANTEYHKRALEYVQKHPNAFSVTQEFLVMDTSELFEPV